MLLQKRSRAARNRRIILIFCVIGLGVLAWFGKAPLTRAYNRHQQGKAIHQAQEFAQKGDLRNAVLSLRIALQYDERNTDALRLAADILERVENKDAIAFREQVSALAPSSIPDRLAEIRTALHFRDYDTAEKLLNAANSLLQKSSEGKRQLASLELARGHPEAAEKALIAAVQLDPQSLTAQFELARLRIRSTDIKTSSAARLDLNTLASSREAVRFLALHELIIDAVAGGRSQEARALAKRLATDPESSFDDQIRRLNVDRTVAGTISDLMLAELQVRAAGNAAEVSQLATWMTLTDKAQAATVWLESLNPKLRETENVRFTYANALAELKDWDRLSEQLETGAWGPIPRDSIRGAMSVRLLYERQKHETAKNAWAEVLALTPKDETSLRILLRLASLWKLEAEAEATLWCIARNAPDGTNALQQLAADYFQRKNTKSLRDTFALWKERHPDNRKANCDWVLASLLLEKGHPSSLVKKKAQELYDAEPGNGNYASAQALSLWHQNLSHEALMVMEKLPKREQEESGHALYFGALLAENHQGKRAIHFLNLASKASLLPEETAILETARAHVRNELPSVLDNLGRK